MKKNFFIFFAILMIAMLGGIFVSCSSDSEEEYEPGIYGSRFKIDDIYYDMWSVDGSTCYVVSNHGEYSGHIVIPSTVNYKGKTLTVVSIDDDAFAGCRLLTGITIPNTISSIGDYAFGWCNLESIVIPNSVTQIGRGAFKGCTNLRNVILSNSIIEIEEEAFSECSSLANVTIPNSVIEIGQYAFYKCNSLTNVTIPNSVVKIENWAFAYCSGFTNVTIPNSVIEIGACTFIDCSNLTNVTIGSSVTKIGNKAFYRCSSNATLYSLNTVPPNLIQDIGMNSFTDEQYMNMNVFVPQKALEAYRSDYWWNKFKNLQGF